MAKIDEPFDEAAFRSDNADQVIVGFDEALGAQSLVDARSRVDKALQNLTEMGAEVIKKFVEAAPVEKAVFALAVIRPAAGSDLTLTGLKNMMADKDERLTDIAFFERNGPIALAGFNDTLF